MTLNKDQFGQIRNSAMGIAWENTVFSSSNSGQPEIIDFGDVQVPRHYHFHENGTPYLSGSDGRSHCRGGSSCPPHTQETRLRMAIDVDNMVNDPEYYANEGGWEGQMTEGTKKRILGQDDS